MKIKSTIVVATAAGAALTPNAADAQTRGRGVTAPPAPVFSWTGFYVGGHLGYAWQKNTAAGAYLDPPNSFPFSHAHNPRGFAGGGQIGYNWQNGSIVYGVEADISGLSGKSSVSSYPDGFPGDSTVTTNSRINWVGTFRGRLGVAVMPRTMVYGTGGLAYGRVQNESTQFEDGTNNISYWGGSKVKTGYAAGGGIEHAVTDKVTLRLEGLFVDLGKQTFAAPNSGNCDSVCAPQTYKNTETSIRGGVNIKFP